MSDVIRSPRQASTIYGMDGNNIPRKKSLFYARFRRTDNGQATVGGGWQDNFSFILKSIDRPSENPKIEELNQYNKKRQIITGIEYEPMNMVLYDVVDNIVFKMWDEYSRYYYGDYNQQDERQFDYDQTLPVTYDNGAGYGYVPRKFNSSVPIKDQTALDLNSQNFFDAIEIYQVFGGYYTQFDLINPKIKTFNPDELDYEQTTISTVNITVTYEAILRQNSGKPMLISENEFVSQVFRDQFNGDTIETESLSRPDFSSALQTTETWDKTGDFYADVISRAMSNTSVTLSGIQSSPAKINYGQYDFGSASSTTNRQSDGTYLLSGSETLKAALSGGAKTMSDALIQTAGAKIGGTAKNSAGTNYLKNTIVSGMIGAGALNKVDPLTGAVVRQIARGATPTQAVVNGVKQTSTGRAALSLQSSVYAVINASKNLRSRIGKKL
jgi:hypothetical protein